MSESECCLNVFLSFPSEKTPIATTDGCLGGKGHIVEKAKRIKNFQMPLPLHLSVQSFSNCKVLIS
jgi:hypothetical protein